MREHRISKLVQKAFFLSFNVTTPCMSHEGFLVFLDLFPATLVETPLIDTYKSDNKLYKINADGCLERQEMRRQYRYGKHIRVQKLRFLMSMKIEEASA